jgi:hypothetical protein
LEFRGPRNYGFMAKHLSNTPSPFPLSDSISKVECVKYYHTHSENEINMAPTWTILYVSIVVILNELNIMR